MHNNSIIKDSEIVVFYHANCYDGFGANWATKHVLDTIPELPSVSYHPAHHGKDDTSLKDKLILYVDYCPKESVLSELGKNNLVLVLDHHETSENYLQTFKQINKSFQGYLKDFTAGITGVFYKFDITQSGAGLTYRYLNQTDELPNMIKYIEDRDLQSFSYGLETKYFHAFLLSHPFDYERWNEIYTASENKTELASFLEKGKSILEYCTQLVKNIVSSAQIYEVNGFKYALFNTTSHWAEVGAYACEALNVDFSISLTMDFKLGQLKGSIRSKPTGDCLPLANHFGGGGHKNGTGFQLPLNLSPMEIKNKIDEFFMKASKNKATCAKYINLRKIR